MIPQGEECRTSIIILRRTPYSDIKYIFSGISPDLGRMGFSYAVPRGNGRRSYACLDIFQELQIIYREGSGDLVRCVGVETVKEYSDVALNHSSYQAACWISRFLMANLASNTPSPGLYRAVQVAMERLEAGRFLPEAILTGVGLEFLREGGWIGVNQFQPAEAAQCELLLRMAQGGATPALTPENWQQLWQWTRSWLATAECHPDTF